MSDYASTGPLQPIVNLVLNPIVAGFFVGQGVLSVVRTPGGAPAGDFTIVLDPGLPGDVGLDGAFGRVTITQRGTLGTLAGGTRTSLRLRWTLRRLRFSFGERTDLRLQEDSPDDVFIGSQTLLVG
jgi:hypothetical protein